MDARVASESTAIQKFLEGGWRRPEATVRGVCGPRDNPSLHAVKFPLTCTKLQFHVIQIVFAVILLSRVQTESIFNWSTAATLDDHWIEVGFGTVFEPRWCGLTLRGIRY